ncbi:glucose dehydrogenase [FAD, quinone]-like isoform X2 [Anthonomus grandis grandis]|uniref:glucose dehydrogenase [FAD, quinone]-like isoform X2 n=1 Tax=Anthonomus grandis grandis TaxID=2921223 RepID=UPI002165AD35|nr:glucose dehydrogenase [FAD, quinone]-like isoform X2 [Anthonomus grandis grandis]
MVLVKNTLILVYLLSVVLFGCFLKYIYLYNFILYKFFYRDDPNNTYDYIIVGAGSAGSILANRLSKNSQDKLLLLEAGMIDNDILHIPSIGLLLQQTEFDWQYKTVPQQNACMGLTGNVSLWPMGKIFGGTSMLNNMLYVRGHQHDYDEWFKNKSDYSIADIWQYFKKIENDKAKSCTERPVYLSDLTFTTILPKIMLKAAETLGYSTIEDNYNCVPGFNIPKANLYQGKRWTSADSLKWPKRDNLSIKTSCIVEKVLFKGNFEAYGVQYNCLGSTYKAFASKAVILSAGVVGSPKILMLSGIGPKAHLKSLGITPIINLPVGENLQDHVTTGFDLVLLNQSLGIGIPEMISPVSIYDYFINGAGPWSTTGCEVMAFFNTLKNFGSPDLQFMVMPLGISEDNGHYLRRLVDQLWSTYFSKITKKTMTILPVLLHPKSKGSVRLASKDFKDLPLIDPQYLSDPRDVEVLLNGIKIIQRLVKTKEFQELGAEFNNLVLPECAMNKFNTKSYWECYIRHLTITAYHPVGTCKMGSRDDESAVVDFDFKVKGTNKLYVADGSVLPTQSSGNINGPIMMLAEMAADLVRKNYYLSFKKCSFFDIFIPKSKC